MVPWKLRKRTTGRYMHRHSVLGGLLLIERLEDRTLLSLASPRSGTAAAVSPQWFQRLVAAPSAATAAKQSFQSIQWNGRSVNTRQDEWIVQLKDTALSGIASAAAAAKLLTGSPFSLQVVS